MTRSKNTWQGTRRHGQEQEDVAGSNKTRRQNKKNEGDGSSGLVKRKTDVQVWAGEEKEKCKNSLWRK